MNTIFWLNNPKILYENYLDFIPNKSMNTTELYNSISLLLIYITILLLIFNRKYVLVPIILLILIVIFNIISDNKTEHFNSNLTYNSDLNNPDQPIYPNDIKKFETGYYDFDDKLRFNRIKSEEINSKNEYKNDLTFECRQPTDNNPFMNPDITDYNSPKEVVACNAADPEIEKNITKSFNSGLFKNIEDVLSGHTSERQFYTVPNTEVPNHENEFANWLYKAPSTCKEDQSKCLRQEDLRYKRSLFV